jgi:hypothetical protein
MTRIPFQPSGYTDGTSEGCKPSSLYTGPHCTCTPEGSTITLDDGEYLALTRITDSGCPIHGMRSNHIPDPHEPAAGTYNRERRSEVQMKGRDRP